MTVYRFQGTLPELEEKALERTYEAFDRMREIAESFSAKNPEEGVSADFEDVAEAAVGVLYDLCHKALTGNEIKEPAARLFVNAVSDVVERMRQFLEAREDSCF
jgi:hypothetical protein